MEPVGHDYEAVITFKQYCGKNNIFHVNKLNENCAKPDLLFFFQNGRWEGKNTDKHEQG